jgi:aspartokinase
MIRIADVIEQKVKSSPLIEEAMTSGLLNISAYARQIHNEIEEKTKKQVTIGSIIMALKRLEKDIQEVKKVHKKIFMKNPDMIVRSNLFEYTVKNSRTVIEKHKVLLDEAEKHTNSFLTITAGVFETTIIASNDLKDCIRKFFESEIKHGEIENLGSITIALTPDVVTIPGVYGTILNQLAWEGINIIEVVSTTLEFTIILKDEDIDRTFSVIKKASF